MQIKKAFNHIWESKIFLYFWLPSITAFLGGATVFLIQLAITKQAPLSLIDQPINKDIFLSYTSSASNKIHHNQLTEIRFVLINNSGSYIGIKEIKVRKYQIIKFDRLIAQRIERRDHCGDTYKIISTDLKSDKLEPSPNQIVLNIDNKNAYKNLLLEPAVPLNIIINSSQIGGIKFIVIVEYFYKNTVRTLKSSVTKLKQEGSALEKGQI